jgi:hypothetical protein
MCAASGLGASADYRKRQVTQRTRTNEELARFAERSVEFEVRMFVSHAWELLERYPDGSVMGLRNNTDDGLLEAWLIHLRLLDEFLRAGQSGKSAVARDWHRGWKPKAALTEQQREAVNRHLAHLRWDRQRWEGGLTPPWERRIREMTDALCGTLIEFIDEIPQPLRESFSKARGNAASWLRDGSRPT